MVIVLFHSLKFNYLIKLKPTYKLKSFRGYIYKVKIQVFKILIFKVDIILFLIFFKTIKLFSFIVKIVQLQCKVVL